jgi:hypothetical protein
MNKLYRLIAAMFVLSVALFVHTSDAQTATCSSEYYDCVDQAQMDQYDCEQLYRTNCTIAYNTAKTSCFDKHCTNAPTGSACCGIIYDCGRSDPLMPRYCCTRYCES